MIRPSPDRPSLAQLLLGLSLTVAWPSLWAAPATPSASHPFSPLAAISAGTFELGDSQDRSRNSRIGHGHDQERRNYDRDRRGYQPDEDRYDRGRDRASSATPQQLRIEERRRQFESLPPQQQQRLLEARERFQRLPPEQRMRLREKWRELPPEERRRWRSDERWDRD